MLNLNIKVDLAGVMPRISLYSTPILQLAKWDRHYSLHQQGHVLFDTLSKTIMKNCCHLRSFYRTKNIGR